MQKGKSKSYHDTARDELTDSLPNIKQKMRHHLDKIQRQLAALPELPNNVELEIQTGLMSFADCTRDKLDEFMRHFSVLPRNFRDCLLEIKPKFTLKDKTDQATIEISDDESEAGSVATNTNTPSKRRSNAAAAVTPSKRQRLDSSVNGRPLTNGHVKPEEISANSLRSVSSRASSARRVVLPDPFTEFTDIGRGFRTLRQVREEIESKTQAGMPDRTSDEVYVDLVLEAVRPWNRPMDAFIRQATRDIQLELESALNKSLETLKRRFIYQEAKKHLRQCINEHRKETEDALVLLYNDEVARLLTFNEGAFKQYRDEEHMELSRFRHYMRMKGAGSEPGPFIRGELLSEDKRAQDTKRREAETLKLGPDQFAREIEVVAYVRGYYRLAALRFADAVSQRIICRMVPSLRRQLPRYLEDKLGVGRGGNASVYERLMEEDQATATKRETLKLERNKFVKAMASIETLETGAPPVAVTVASGSSVSTSVGSFSVADTQREGMMAIDEVDEDEEV